MNDDPFSTTVGQWWTLFRIVLLCIALGGALYAWAKPIFTNKLDYYPTTARSRQPDPENVGKMKRMLTMLGIAAFVWWFTSDDGIDFVEDVFSFGADIVSSEVVNTAENPFAGADPSLAVDGDLYFSQNPTTSTTS